MELWHLWTAILASGIGSLSASLHVSEAVAIILLTLGVRLALMPLSLGAALRMDDNREKLKRIKPALDALKATLAGHPAELSAATMRLYREHDIRFVDRLALANMGSQAIFGLGIFQTVRSAGFGTRFLWITSLAKPDVWVTIVVGVLMLVGMGIAPGALSDPSMLVMLCVSVAVAVFAVAAMPSAVGIYWAASNVATIFQGLVLRVLVARRRRSTAVAA